MKIILSHSNTDFDGLAGMVAAQKLHPDAIIVLRGNEEPQVKRFLDNPFYTFPTRTLSDIDLNLIKEIICVDFSRMDRLGHELSSIKPNKIRFTVYDHHGEDCSIQAAEQTVEPVGAVTTLLVEKLLKREIPVTQLEATLYMLGIYEDTGMLTHVTTTSRDIRAAATLMDMGADLSLVTKFLRYELTPAQIQLFNRLVSYTEIHNVSGTPVAIARAYSEDYIPDAAVVVQKIMEIEGHISFFAVMRMADKIHIIGRSRDEAIDVGEILEKLSGGGHGSAGSATLTGKTEVEAVELLLREMRKIAGRQFSAAEIMSGSLITVDSSKTLRTARNIFTRNNINVLPVVDAGRVRGIITRQQIDRALAHKLRGKVSEFMRSDFSLIPEETNISEVEHLLMSGTDRAVLVGTPPDRARGIITRMDLFRRLYLEKLPKATANEVQTHKRSHNIAEMVENRLPDDITQLMKEITRICEKRDERAFLVGGIVRDIFLNIENRDVDILVAGDAIEFAATLAEVCGGRLHSHERFRTAVVIINDEFRIDFASARSESYSSPGALPEVRSGGLRADMFRRDFTINAMAMSLHPQEYGLLIDYFGGRRDLQNKTVRILHSLSFIDDPTRVLRALRFCARFGFSLSRGTRDSLEVSLERKMIWKVSGKRLQNEMQYIFSSGRAIKAVELLEEHGVLQALHRKFRLDRFTRSLLEKIGKTLNWFNITFPSEEINILLPYLMALMEKLTGKERSALARKLQLSQGQRQDLVNYKRQVKKVVMLGKGKSDPKPSKVTFTLEHFSLPVILYAHAFVFSDTVKKEIQRFLVEYRTVTAELDGDDIREHGLPQGPAYATILKRLRKARLDGRVKNREEEIALMDKLVDKYRE